MSQENVEFIRRAYREGYASRSVDAEGLRDRVAEDFRFHMRPGWPGRVVYGLDDLTELWADLDNTYTEYELIPEDFLDAGEFVLVTVRQSARVRGSDARIEAPLWHVWQLRDGIVHEAWAFDVEDEARDAAGLGA